MRAHGCEALVDDAALALLDLVHRRLHVVVDAALGNPAQRRERTGMGIEQHLVPLARVGHQPEGAAGAQLHVRDLQPAVNAAHHQPLFAPVELKGFAQREPQRHEGPHGLRLARTEAPLPDEVRHAGIAAGVTLVLDLGKQRARRAPVALGAMRIGRKRLRQPRLEQRQLARPIASSILGTVGYRRRLDPLLDGVARQSSTPRNLRSDNRSRQNIRRIFPNISMVITFSRSCPKIEQSRLYTWISFRSALPSKVGQFSAGVNSHWTPAPSSNRSHARFTSESAPFPSVAVRHPRAPTNSRERWTRA